jgi:hypothetical protein
MLNHNVMYKARPHTMPRMEPQVFLINLPVFPPPVGSLMNLLEWGTDDEEHKALGGWELRKL